MRDLAQTGQLLRSGHVFKFERRERIASTTPENASFAATPDRSVSTIHLCSIRRTASTVVFNCTASPNSRAMVSGISSRPSGNEKMRPFGPPLVLRFFSAARISDPCSCSIACSLGNASFTDSSRGSPA
jgi:hypothetical protein